MTSRESTNLLSLQGDEITLSLSDRLTVLAYGAIQWPWLLRSLDGGRKAEKAKLLKHLGLAEDALPNLGSWKADTHFLWHMVRLIEELRPAQVLELGCGASSFVMARALQLNGGGKLTSFDQHLTFVESTRDWLADNGLEADLRHAPLGTPPSGWPGHWYQLHDLPDQVDLLVVDGPPWALHPLGRGAAATLFPLIRKGGAVLLDDAARPGERMVARRWRREHPEIAFRLDRGGAKGTLVGRKS